MQKFDVAFVFSCKNMKNSIPSVFSVKLLLLHSYNIILYVKMFGWKIGIPELKKAMTIIKQFMVRISLIQKALAHYTHTTSKCLFYYFSLSCFARILFCCTNLKRSLSAELVAINNLFFSYQVRGQKKHNETSA